jgi:FlaA1/EpsC-like NDP-sugar epimerase
MTFPSSLGRSLTQLAPKKKLALLLGTDGVLLPLCACVALLLSNYGAADINLADIGLFLLVSTTTQVVLYFTGLYRSVVRFIDLRAVTRTAFGLVVNVLLLQALVLILSPPGIPMTAPAIYWFVAFTYLMTTRFYGRSLLLSGLKKGGQARRKTLIFGAGNAGVQLARAMFVSPEYQATCFIDDNPNLRKKIVTGLPVFGPEDLPAVVSRYEIEQIVVAMPSAPLSARRALIKRLETIGVPVKTLPGLVDLVDGEAPISAIRDVDVSDLLGRDPVPPEPSLFARSIRGKVVLVTGAGGSIGSELCRQIVSQQPRKLVLFDHSEFALYTIEQELAHLRGECSVVSVLGSVLDESLLMAVFGEHAVQTAYHAAAYKHVPMVEMNVRQGVLNNVFGTLTMANAAKRCGLETCVLVSTDKAVRPTNVMGASKRIAELIFQAAEARGDGATVFSMVRFGNVLGSSGSVVPLFKRQIQAGGPITITHPDIIRYFMLIPEAAQLVIQAGAMARGGEVFVLDMGEPVRIADLARTLIRLSGLSERSAEQPDGDIEISFVGLRPGEKLYEELLIGDNTVPSGHPRIMCAMERHIEPVLLDKMLGALRSACEQGQTDALLRLVGNLVPEYHNSGGINAAGPSEMVTSVS